MCRSNHLLTTKIPKVAEIERLRREKAASEIKGHEIEDEVMIVE